MRDPVTVPSSRSSSLSIIFRGQNTSQPSIDRWTAWLIPGAHFISINPSPESSVSVSPQNSACSGMIKSHLNQFWNSSFHNIRRMCIPRFSFISLPIYSVTVPDLVRSTIYSAIDRTGIISSSSEQCCCEMKRSHRMIALTSLQVHAGLAIKWSCYMY